MDAGGICVARAMPIDAALVEDVLIGLRRDTPGAVARWTLGGRGSAEIDIDFFPVMTGEPAPVPAWTTSGRLWDPAGVVMASVVVELVAESADECKLTVRPASGLAPWWSNRVPALLDLVHATVDELGEELLWHASRDGVTAGTR